MTRPVIAQSGVMPAPVGGWNARDPLTNMAETDAIELENWFPDNKVVRLRKGFSLLSTISGLSKDIPTLYEHVTATGARVLLASCDGNIYDVSASAASSLTGAIANFTNDKWVVASFKGTGTTDTRSIWVNGQDAPLFFNGTAFSVAAYTGISDQTKISYVTTFKQRVYLLESNTNRNSLWFTATNAFDGALTEFAGVVNLFKRGGKIIAMTSWGRDTGDGTQELFVMLSNMGEILVYLGDNPDVPWTLTGRYYIAAPVGSYSTSVLGARPMFNLGSDVIIMTIEGAISLSSVIASQDLSPTKVTDKIQNAFNEKAYDNASFYGWEGINYPKGHMLLLNIPIVDSTTSTYQANQYVMNTLSGAWCKFTGMNARCFSLFNNALCFGGTDGKVYKADDSLADNSMAIPTKLSTAFSYINDPIRQKRIIQVRPLFTVTEGFGTQLGVDVDFKSKPLVNTISFSSTGGSSWDADDWDLATWADADIFSDSWFGVDGFGRSVSVKMAGNYTDISAELSAFYIRFEPGGYG